MEKRLIDESKRLLLSSLDNTCIDCILGNTTNGYGHIDCPKNNSRCRIGFIEGNKGVCYVCSKNSKTTANFKESLSSTYHSIPQLKKLFDEVRQEVAALEVRRVNQVVHNLKNLHGHSIQELSLFLPQDKFTFNVNSTQEAVKKQIQRDSSAAALSILRLIKINNGIKAEFSIYDKLIRNDGVNPQLSLKPYSIQDVVFLVAQPFFEDFHQKNVWFALGTCTDKAVFDFETIFSALYHIIGNATKYVEPSTRVNVAFKTSDEYIVIDFNMSSLHLYPEDLEHLFDEGYSGLLARKYNENGQGLGMYRAKIFVQWNKGTIEVIAGEKIKSVKGVLYSDNVIRLRLLKADR